MAKVTSTSERLKEIIHERKLKQVDIIRKTEKLAASLGVDFELKSSVLSHYVNGNLQPGSENFFLIAAALNVSPLWLLGYDVPQSNSNLDVDNNVKDLKMNTIPVLSVIKGSDNLSILEWASQSRTFIERDYSNITLFYYKVIEDSMTPLIPEQTYVLCSKQNTARNGDLVIIRDKKDNCVYIRKLIESDKSKLLFSLNSTILPLDVSNKSIEILGKVIKVEIDF